MPLMVAPSGTPGTGDWAVLGTGGVSRYVVFHGPYRWRTGRSGLPANAKHTWEACRRKVVEARLKTCKRECASQ